MAERIEAAAAANNPAELVLAFSSAVENYDSSGNVNSPFIPDGVTLSDVTDVYEFPITWCSNDSEKRKELLRVTTGGREVSDYFGEALGADQPVG